MNKFLAFILLLMMVALIGCKQKPQEEMNTTTTNMTPIECCAMQAHFGDKGAVPFIVCDTDIQEKELTTLNGVPFYSFYNRTYYQCACVNNKLENATFKIVPENSSRNPLLSIFQGC